MEEDRKYFETYPWIRDSIESTRKAALELKALNIAMGIERILEMKELRELGVKTHMVVYDTRNP